MCVLRPTRRRGGGESPRSTHRRARRAAPGGGGVPKPTATRSTSRAGSSLGRVAAAAARAHHSRCPRTPTSHTTTPGEPTRGRRALPHPPGGGGTKAAGKTRRAPRQLQAPRDHRAWAANTLARTHAPQAAHFRGPAARGRTPHTPRESPPGGLLQTLKQACSRMISRSAMCVQRFDDSLSSAIHITYRISLRSSSLQ